MKNLKVINRQLIAESYDYKTYRSLIDTLFAENKTTGNNHNDAMLHYAKMNIQRMKRLEKTAKLLPEAVAEVAKIERKQIWLTITEGWCGDAAQILPFVEQLAQSNPNIEHRLILRDEHLEVMDEFLTNGGSRSIPITVILDADTLKVMGHWGSRPAAIQQWLIDAKKVQDTDWNALKTDMQRWYAKDKGVQIQKEFVTAVKEASASTQLAF